MWIIIKKKQSVNEICKTDMVRPMWTKFRKHCTGGQYHAPRFVGINKKKLKERKKNAKHDLETPNLYNMYQISYIGLQKLMQWPQHAYFLQKNIQNLYEAKHCKKTLHIVGYLTVPKTPMASAFAPKFLLPYMPISWGSQIFRFTELLYKHTLNGPDQPWSDP